jgi:glyoxylase-like metal-dependent hydrolase (beta-lactamase superfamily II)
MSETTPEYEIYAVKYGGPYPRKLASVLWLEGWDEQIDINYYVWVIRGGGETIVVDTGTGPGLAVERRLSPWTNPVDVLSRIGATAGTVTRVILTHLHWDHSGGMETFPETFSKATFYVQKREFDFWVFDSVARRRNFARLTAEAANRRLPALAEQGRLVSVPGDAQILPGIELLLCPGHTVGLQAVAVNTAKGTAVVASDCCHSARALPEDNTSAFITDMVAWMGSYDKIRGRVASADLVFPGHDVSLLRDYPRVAEDVTRLV